VNIRCVFALATFLSMLAKQSGSGIRQSMRSYIHSGALKKRKAGERAGSFGLQQLLRANALFSLFFNPRVASAVDKSGTINRYAAAFPSLLPPPSVTGSRSCGELVNTVWRSSNALAAFTLQASWPAQAGGLWMRMHSRESTHTSSGCV